MLRIRRTNPPAAHAVEPVNVTPMIDVVMCLIVFYLIVGNLASDSRPPVDLPKASATEDAMPGDPIVLTLDASPGSTRARLGTRELDVTRLENELAAARITHPDAALELRADRALPYASIAPALEAARAAGFVGVRLVASPASHTGARRGDGP